MNLHKPVDSRTAGDDAATAAARPAGSAAAAAPEPATVRQVQAQPALGSAGPAAAGQRFYVKEGYCGFGFDLQACPFLSTAGVATCIGFTLYDQVLHVGALAHFDSDNVPDPNNVKAFDPAFDAFGVAKEIVNVLLQKGSQREHLRRNHGLVEQGSQNHRQSRQDPSGNE